MKKIILTLFFMITFIFCIGKSNEKNKPKNNTQNKSNKENCFKYPGELTCATDLTTKEGMGKALAAREAKREYYEHSSQYFKKGRFGNEIVGFIDFPKKTGEIDWILFHDPDASQYTLQLSRGFSDIYTLDVINIDNVVHIDKSLSEKDKALYMIQIFYDGYLQAGHRKDNLNIKEVKVGNYTGYQLKIKEISGKSLVKNIVVINKKMYFITAEAIPKNINEMEKHMLKTWRPDR